MILCVGPFDGVVTGQRSCLEVAADSFAEAERVSVGGEGVGIAESFLTVFLGFFRVLLYCLSNSERTLYLTPSRSAFGFLRDLAIFCPMFFFRSRRIAHWHGADVSVLKKKQPLIYRFYVIIYRRFKVHIVLTEGMKEQISDFIADDFSELIVIPNFHDIAISEKASSHGEAIKILYFSNIMVEKGALDFLSVAANILKRSFRKRVEFHMAGPLLGFSAEQLGRELARLGLEGQPGLTIHGPVYGEDKDRLLKECDILLFPSVYVTEAFPLVVLEAMASGMYVVAYDHNYMADILSNGRGELAPSGDVEAMTSSVAALIDGVNLPELQDNSRRVAEEFDKESYQARVRTAVLAL